MQVKRFVAANMRLALKMVKEEMGPDAVILSNKRVADGVELLISIEAEAPEDQASQAQHIARNPFHQATMASEREANREAAKGPEPSNLSLEVERMQRQAKQRAKDLSSLLSKKNQEELEQAINAAEISSSTMDTAALKPDTVDFSVSLASQMTQEPAAPVVTEVSLPAPVSHDDLTDMRFELQSMRDLLEQQFKSMGWANFSQQKPQQAGVWKRLKRMGISANITEPLLSRHEVADGEEALGASKVWQNIMADLCQQLPVVSDDLIAEGGVFAFVGPTGAGKTTTIGKLAARYVLKHGADNVALVTTDTMRIAAHEQLRTFGRILNVPVKIVDKNNSLERVLYSLRRKSLVLVDTAGLNRQDPRLQQQLNSLNEAGSRLRSLLVLPTTSQVAVLKSAYHTYSTDNLCGCVLTKLDECASLGEAVSLAIDKSMPVAYTTNGQGIPDDIEVAETAELIRQAISLAKNIDADDASMAEEFGSLVR